MPRERFPIIFVLSFLVVLISAGALQGAPGTDAPYTGVIQNHTCYSISIPSANSDGTLIVPPGGWVEYVAWVPEFKLTGFVCGRAYYCEKIKVIPKNFQFMCKSYDFLAEIKKEEPARKPAAPARKKRPVRKLKANEVEGLG
jgi:hypothetical protein